MSEMVKKIKEANPELEYVFPPIELFSGRAYISFTVGQKNRNGKIKEKECPMRLSKCPFCGEKYDDTQEVASGGQP